MMASCCECRKDVVCTDTQVARSFAAVGLLRHVTDAIPQDLINTYIFNSSQSFGLRNLADAYSLHELEYDDKKTVKDVNFIDQVKCVPPGLVKMAKDYLIRQFWKQVRYLTNGSCMQINSTWYDPESGHDYARLYPRNVLETIRALRISPNARFWDLRDQIGALHAVCTPVMTELPNWAQNFRKIELLERDFDVLRRPEMSNIATLNTILMDYCWKDCNRSQIPNDIERNILLDLIDSFLVMFGPKRFTKAFVYRQIYEFARIQGVFDQNRRVSCFSDVSELYSREHEHAYYDWINGVDTIVEDLKHISPQTAICACQFNKWNGIRGASSDAFRKMNPNPLNEVAIYLKLELKVQREKAKTVKRIIEARKQGKVYEPDGGFGDPPPPCDLPEGCLPMPVGGY